MTIDQFQDFVAANIDWFHGRLPETDSSLQQAEKVLGVKLPRTLKWLLTQHGYWHGTGVSNLNDTINDTLDARRLVALPNHFVVLENFQDAGVILIDTSEVTPNGEAPLYWVGLEDVGNLPRLETNSRYDSFGDYVKDRLKSAQDFIEQRYVRYVRYDPADFPEGRGDG